jgi:pimeloyl-ACP methyl ester carboxylesterase
MPKVQVNDIEMYYEVHGEGTPVVFITGYSGTSQGVPFFIDFPPMIENHKVILLDNRGIGKSSTSEEPYSIKLMASDIAALLDALNISKAHILGGSMGGMIAQEVAINYPEKVISLVLVGTSPGGKKVWDLPGQLKAFYQMSWDHNPPEGMTGEEILDTQLNMYYSDDYLEKNRSNFSYNRVTEPVLVETLGKQYYAFVNHDAYDRLPSIKHKTLILHGSEDGLTFPEGAVMLDERIPDSELVMFEGLKHNIGAGDKSRFTKFIIDFLKDVDG